jgi:hypothetical protein
MFFVSTRRRTGTQCHTPTTTHSRLVLCAHYNDRSFEVEIPPETVLSGVFPALRTFTLNKADDLGVEVTSDGAGRKAKRVTLKAVPKAGEEPQVEAEPAEAVINDNKKK